MKLFSIKKKQTFYRKNRFFLVLLNQLIKIINPRSHAIAIVLLERLEIFNGQVDYTRFFRFLVTHTIEFTLVGILVVWIILLTIHHTIEIEIAIETHATWCAYATTDFVLALGKTISFGDIHKIHGLGCGCGDGVCGVGCLECLWCWEERAKGCRRVPTVRLCPQRSFQ